MGEKKKLAYSYGCTIILSPYCTRNTEQNRNINRPDESYEVGSRFFFFFLYLCIGVLCVHCCRYIIVLAFVRSVCVWYLSKQNLFYNPSQYFFLSLSDRRDLYASKRSYKIIFCGKPKDLKRSRKTALKR